MVEPGKWTVACKNKEYHTIWEMISQLTSEHGSEVANASKDAWSPFIDVFRHFQQREPKVAAQMLGRIEPMKEQHFLFNFASLMAYLYGENPKLSSLEKAMMYDKGELFSFAVASFEHYGGLLDTLFTHSDCQPFMLQSAYNVSMYPWLYTAVRERSKLPTVIKDLRSEQLKAVVYYLNEDYLKALLHLIPLVKGGENHWIILWFTAKSAFYEKKKEFVEGLCDKILQQKPEFWFARELKLHISGYYSQFSQDKIAEQFFKSFKPKQYTCVEVGAFDGIHYSNVRHFTDQGNWKSLHFEPVSDNFNRLSHAYRGNSQARVLRKAVSPVAGTIDLHVSSYSHLSEWGSDVASVVEEEKQRWDSFSPDWHVEKVETITLDEAIEEAGFEGIDLLSIDAEGYDLEVLMTLDLSRIKPELVIIEYGPKRKEILEYAQRFGFTLYDDNGQDLFLTPAQTVPLTKVESLFNPHFLKVHSVTSPIMLQKIHPRHLLHEHRFDLSIKYAYAKHFLEGTMNEYVMEAYKEHIRAFNNFKEGDGSDKNSFEAFKGSFEALIEGMDAEGFNPEVSLIPLSKEGVVMDGAHRIAAAIAIDVPVLVAKTNLSGNVFSSEYFKARGLSEKWCDFAMMSLVELNYNLKTLTLFPSAEGFETEVERFIQQHTPIFYKKTLELDATAGFNLIRQMYKDEPWLGDHRNGFSGARFKAKECFKGRDKVRLYLIEETNLDLLRELKEKIRALYKVENHSVHTNDTHFETRIIAGALLNEHSLFFLHQAQVKPFDTFYSLMLTFQQWLKARKIPEQAVCVDGSCTLSALGLRDCGDLDFLHVGDDMWNTGIPGINSHNIHSQLRYHAWSKDEILFNPDLHFYFNGIKFIAPHAIKAMKQNRNEGKDVKDVEMIDQVLSQSVKLVSLDDFQYAPEKVEGKKIIGLVPVKNEAQNIEFCLKALANITDGIIVLDDHSEDSTVELIHGIAESCNVIEIIEKSTWHRDEPGDRNTLLEAGRNHGGTHFIVIDADEAFTSNVLINNGLRRSILALQPGEKMAFTWIQLWRDLSYYRFDDSVWTWNIKPFIFCDDGVSKYDSEFIHTNRFPSPLPGRFFVFKTYDIGMLHFQFVNWHNLLVKQAWYRILERIRTPKKSISEINTRYAPSKDEKGLHVRPSPLLWFKEYLPFLDSAKFSQKESWRTKQVQGWFKEYGFSFFKELDIWDVDWGVDVPYSPSTGVESSAEVTSEKKTEGLDVSAFIEEMKVLIETQQYSEIRSRMNILDTPELHPIQQKLTELIEQQERSWIRRLKEEFDKGNRKWAFRNLETLVKKNPEHSAFLELELEFWQSLDQTTKMEEIRARLLNLTKNSP